MAKVYLSEVRRAVKRTVVEVSYEALYKAHQRSGVRKLPLEVFDLKYRVLPIETWQLFLEWSGVDRLKYQNEFLDCDDFASILIGECKRKLQVNGIGMVIDTSGRHAYNALAVATDDGLRVATIEPQNDALIIRYEGMYDAESGCVRF